MYVDDKIKSPGCCQDFFYDNDFNYFLRLFWRRDLKKLPVLRLLPSGLPIRSIAQRKPNVLSEWSSSRKRRVPGLNQYGRSFQLPPLYTLEWSLIKVVSP